MVQGIQKMKNMTVFHLFLLGLVFAAEKSMAAPSGSSTTVSYDELQLVFQWPTSYCNTGRITCINHIPLRFTVHGLWLNKNSQRVNCNYPANTCINLLISKDLQKYMNRYWPNLNSQTPRNFLWLHEYKTHGYGIPEFPNQEDYFQTARTIATNIGDVKQMRLSSGRTLTRGKFYDVNEFNPVVIAGRILIPRLRCNYASDSVYPQLQEIVFCADRNYILKNCTYDVGRCRQDFYGKVLSGRSFKFP